MMNDFNDRFRAVASRQTMVAEAVMPQPKRVFRLERARRFAHTQHWHKIRHYASLAFCVYLAVICAGVLQVVGQQQNLSRYQLSNIEQELLGKVSPALSSKLSFQTAQQAFLVNANYVPPADSQQVGGMNYTAVLPTDPMNQGIALTDPAHKLTVTLTPQFSSQIGKAQNGHVIYPVNGANADMVYTVKSNGLKEDIVLPSYQRDKMSFTYKLGLPNGLESRLRPDGSIGIYGGDPALFSNVSTGSAQDQQLLDKARSKATKTNLMFVIPAPTVKEANGSPSAKAAFTLKGDLLTVRATNLSQGHYPLSIDPSLALASTSDWTTGNGEDNIDFSVSGQIGRADYTGGSLTSFSTTTNGMGAGIQFIYNGYAYALGNAGGFNAKLGSDGASFISTTTNVNYPTYANSQIIDFTVYNGYAYAIGGIDQTATNAPCGGALQPACTYSYTDNKGTAYAKINPDGTLGTWTATSNLLTAHFQGGAAAYNGYIYAYDSYSPTGNDAGTTQYAKINPDGTLGNWASSSSISSPTVGNNNTFSVYNGYVYIAGGVTGATTISNTVYYAPLGSSGVGTWQTTASLPVATENGAMGAYNGYLYYAGGCTTISNFGCTNKSSQGNSVYYAPLYANGTLGSWQSTSALSAAQGREYPGGGRIIGHNNYLYTGGGFYCNGAGGSCGTLQYYTDTQYSPIDASGGTTSYSAANPMGSSADWDALASGYGYLYSIGGCTGATATTANCTTGTDQTTTRVGKINADGSLTWSTTTALPAGRWNAQATVYNGYLYVAGGCTNTLGGCTGKFDILYAQITPSTGAIGSWSTATATLDSNANQGFSFFGYGNALYQIGGHTAGSATVTADVSYFSLSASTGNLTARTATTALTGGGEAWGDGWGYGGRLYVSTSSHVWMNTVNVDGTVGATWTQAASYSHNAAAATVYKGYVYFSSSKTMQVAPINSDGTMGSLVTLSSLTNARQYHAVVAYNDQLYVYGGCTNTTNFAWGSEACTASQTTVETANLNNGGPGQTNAWANETNSLPVGLEGPQVFIANGFIYAMGGVKSGTVNSTASYYAPITSDGTIGTWATTTSLSSSADTTIPIRYNNGYVYAVGGNTACGTQVLFDTVSPTGGLGASWSRADTQTIPGGLTCGLSAVIYHNRLYVFAGYNGGNTCDKSIYYATIQANGTLSTWTTSSTQFTNYHSDDTASAATVYNGYLYMPGGYGTARCGGSGTTFTSSVEYAKLDTDGNGTVGPMRSATPFPIGHGRGAYAVANGYFYALSGQDEGSNPLTTYRKAPILPNGDLGQWETGSQNNLQSRVDEAALSPDGTHILEIGGSDLLTGGSKTSYSSIETAIALTIPRVAHYSKLFVTDKDTSPVNTTLSFSGSNATQTCTVSTATAASPTFGSATSLSLTTDVKNTQLGQSPVSYYYYYCTLDDSSTAIFPDSQSTQTAYTQLKVNYHPNPSMRLRGGATFNQTLLQSLDAP